MDQRIKRTIDRRRFLALADASGVGLGLAACNTLPPSTPRDNTTTTSSPPGAPTDEGIKTAVERIGVAPLKAAAQVDQPNVALDTAQVPPSLITVVNLRMSKSI